MNANDLMTTLEAAALVQQKARELGGIAASSTNTKYVRSYGRIVFRVVCVAVVGGKKKWEVAA